MPIDALDALIGTPYGSTTRRRPAGDLGALAGILSQALQSQSGLQYSDPGILLSLLGTIRQGREQDEALAREEQLRQEELALQQQQMDLQQSQGLAQQAAEWAMGGKTRAEVESTLGALSSGLSPGATANVQSAFGALYPQTGPRWAQATGLSPASGLIPSRGEVNEIREIVARGIRNGDSEEDVLGAVEATFREEGPEAAATARTVGQYVYREWSKDPEHFRGGGLSGPRDAGGLLPPLIKPRQHTDWGFG